MRVLVDADGVLADWGAEYDRRLGWYGTATTGQIPRTADQQQWNLLEGRTAREQDAIRKIMAAPYFYRDLDLIEGAKESLEAALAAGHDVRIVSTPDPTNPTCASDKLAWVAECLGPEWVKRLILTADKTLIRGDILIDDKPEITGSVEPEWIHVLFGDYAYNRNASAAIRMRSWGTPEKLLELLDLIGEDA